MKDNYEILSDEELFSLLSESKEVSHIAFSILYNRYSKIIYTYIYKFLGKNKFFIQDIYQEAFIRLYKLALTKQFQDITMNNFHSYLYQIVKNLCISYHNNKERQEKMKEELEQSNHINTSNEEETLELVREAVAKLPYNLREIFILSEYEGLSYDTIEKITGIKQSNIRVRIYRARKLIKEMVVNMRKQMNKVS